MTTTHTSSIGRDVKKMRICCWPWPTGFTLEKKSQCNNNFICSHVLVVILSFIILPLRLVHCLTPVDQIDSLRSLYNHTNGETWRWRNESVAGSRWSFSSQPQQQDDPCSSTNNMAWQGITCSSSPLKCKTTSCNIEDIDLELYGLSGSLPDELFALTTLTSLRVSQNRLVGSIPSAVGKLLNLRSIILFNNELSGSLPSFESMSQLQTCSIYNNQIIGSIPSTFGLLSRLNAFSIDGNYITNSLPSSFGSLSQLQYLSIYNNDITGSIPSSFGSLSQLQYFWSHINRITGSIPSSLGSLSNLKDLYIHYNRITGSFPSSLKSLSQLQYFVTYNNHITGSIPSSFGSLSQLQHFYIHNNHITGSIPSSLGSLSQLQYFFINNNLITGSIPSSFGSLFRLQDFSIYTNHITGSISPSFGSLLQLKYLSIYDNHISGSLPSSFGSFPLIIFLIYNNQITGSIPSSYGSLSQLQYFDINNNYVTGCIPMSFGLLSQLQNFDLGINYITGSVPPSLGLLSQLQDLYIYNNQITGYIPSSLNNLINLQYFHAYNNLLIGTIPLHLTSFPHLQQLFVQQNQFTGSLDALISDSNHSSLATIRSVNLTNLDVSGNRLAGSIPGGVFLSSLESIALSVNCFEGELPESMCDGVNLRVMSLDGLNSARDCRKKSTRIPLTGVSLGGMISGGIPDCVWKLSNLETLHMAGNGLRGTIGKETYTSSPSSSMSRLIDLTLSHNYLSGEIPGWLLEKRDMVLLDLSHNKLTGDLDRMSKVNDDNMTDDQYHHQTHNQTQRTLKLTVNRLSGSSPVSTILSEYWSLDILSGNLFGCANLPSNDESNETYVCGSSEYNRSLFGFAALAALLLLVMLFYFLSVVIIRYDLQSSSQNSNSSFFCSYFFFLVVSCLRRCCEKSVVLFNQLMSYHRFYLYITATTISTPQSSFKEFGRSLVATQQLFIITAVAIIGFSIPLYVVKNAEGNSFVTHHHQYQWSFTMSYLSGSLPGVMVLMVCMLSLVVFSLALYKFKFNVKLFDNSRKMEDGDQVVGTHSSMHAEEVGSVDQSSDTNVPSNISDLDLANVSIIQSLSGMDWFLLCLISFLNLVIVGTVNGLYIWSTIQDSPPSSRLLIQLGVSSFGIMWKVILRSIIPSRVKNSFSGMWLLSVIGVLNGVVIPCLVTSFTSPTCYQRLIIEPDEISSSYSYTTCTTWIFGGKDNRYCVSDQTISMEVLELIPPFTYSYQCGSTLLTSYIPVYLFSSVSQIIIDMCRVLLRLHTKDTDYPRFVRQRFLLPHQSLHPSKTISNIITNLMLLLSFGLSSPVLCVSVCLSGVIDMSSDLILLGRVLLLYGNEERGMQVVAGSGKGDGRELKKEREASAVVDNESGKMELEIELTSTQTNLSCAPIAEKIQIDIGGAVIDDDVETPKDSMKKLLEEIKDHSGNALMCVARCRWLIMTPSCLLMTLLSWDVAGDEEGWDGSYWIALTGVGVMIVVVSLDYLMVRLGQSSSCVIN